MNSSTVQLQQSILHDVASLFDNTDAMKKLQKYLRKLKEKEIAKDVKEEMTTAEKEEILDDIREGLRELKLVKEGKLKARPVEELLNEL